VPSADAVLIAPAGWWTRPERTIYLEVASWCAEYLRLPDGPDAGSPWRFTNQQARILSYWFAFDETDRWLYRRGTIRMCKGWGKDPLAAVLSAVELAGPCRVKDGQAVEHTSPWIQIAAVSREQTKTTMRLFPGLFSELARDRYALDINKEIIYARGGRGVIEAVTSSPSSLEGGRASLVVKNEVQEWKSSNEGHDMSEVIDGNLTKSRDGAARALSIGNAHIPGEDSVGEREWDAWQRIAGGGTRLKDVLYIAVEAPADTRLDDEESLRVGLLAARGDATWLDPDRHIGEIWDPRTTPSEGRRKYLNQIIAAEDAWLAPHEWLSCEDKGARLEDTQQVALGFDGSKSDDHTALVATRIEDGCEFLLGHWDPALTGGEIRREEVDAAVAGAFERFDVVAFYSDLHPWESYVDAWAKEFGTVDRARGLCLGASTKHPIAWDMRGRTREFVRAAERFHEEVVDRRLRYAPSDVLTQHALNARRRMDRHGVSFGKEHRESKRKVDAVAACVLSRLAWHDYEALPREKKRRARSGRATFV
jgi:phage terminase large subunit-like protein